MLDDVVNMLSNYLQFKDVIGYDSPDIIYLFNHPIFVSDSSLRLLGSNVKAQEILTEAFAGHLVSFFEGKSLIDIFDIDLESQDFLKSVMSNEQYKKSPNFTFISKLKGSDRVYEGNCIPIRSMTGQDTILFCFLDKTDQLKSDEALHYKETLFDSVMENSNDAVIVLSDQEGSIELFNLSAEKLFGYSSLEILIETGDILFDYETWVRVQDAMTQLNESNPPSSIPITDAVGTNCEQAPLQLSLSVSKYEPDGRTLYIISATDVTFYKALVDAMEDAFVCFSPAGQVINWNQAAVVMLGWANAEWESLRFADLQVMHSVTGEVFANIADVATTSGIEVEEMTHLAIKTKKGRYLPMKIKCWPHYVNSEQHFYFLMTPIRVGNH